MSQRTLHTRRRTVLTHRFLWLGPRQDAVFSFPLPWPFDSTKCQKTNVHNRHSPVNLIQVDTLGRRVVVRCPDQKEKVTREEPHNYR